MTFNSKISKNTISDSTQVCSLCKNGSNIERIDEYKHMLDSDSKALGEMELVRCLNCDLGFAHPFPSFE
jgi:hypothetical protein